MVIFIIIFGALTLLAGIIIIVNPVKVFSLLNKHIEKLELHILAVVIRLILGGLLVYSSAVSRFPLIIEIIGWISIVAAVFFAVIGRNNFKRLMSWALSLQKPFGRFGGFLAICFGALLIYAFV
jgi:hypothetical protein